jgi:hypothetical protein
MRVKIEIVSKNWKQNGPRQEDQFRRNEIAALLRGMADRLQNGGAAEARFDQGNGVIGTLEIAE